jgi:hypothetical protein
MKKNLIIVYYVWINEEKNWQAIVRGQLEDIHSSGILMEAKIHIVISCENINLIDPVRKYISNILIVSKVVDYELDFYNSNLFEYYGLKKLHDLSLRSPENIFLYLHAKGMSNNYKNIDSRHFYELFLTKTTVLGYKKIIELFNLDSEISVCGLFPSNMHNKKFIWFNFFWARGSYLVTCETPKISSNRFYFETWIESGSSSEESVFNIYEMNRRKYSLKEAADILNSRDGDFLLNS